MKPMDFQSDALLSRDRSRVDFLRARDGTLFAAEVHHARRWDDAFLAAPNVDVADVRIVFFGEGDVPRDMPGWLAVAPPPINEAEAGIVDVLAAAAWPHSPYYRLAPASPDAYLRAAYHALCPPHPACPVGPHVRATVLQFVRGRRAPLGALARAGRYAADRLLQACWSTPEALARAILLERLCEMGAGTAADLIRGLEAARIDRSGVADALLEERGALLVRLDPVRYFTEHDVFVAALRDAEEWWARYLDARQEYRRRVAAAAATALAELEPAIAASAELRALNRDAARGTPVGPQALARFEAAVEALRALYESREDGGLAITVGGGADAFAEAHYDAAGVLAALEVQRRRAQVSAPP